MKWKSVGIAFIQALGVFFSIFVIHGADVATGTTVSGHISVDTTWDLARSPFIVMENVIVDPGVTLTIEPGVEVKFDPAGTHDYLSIFVEGTLHSVGQANKLINFTSNSISPSYDWFAVQINATGTANIENCSFSYGEGLILKSFTGQTVRNNVFPHTAVVITRTPGHNISNSTFNFEGGISLSSANNTVSDNFLSQSSIWLNVGGNVISGNTLEAGYGGILPGVMVDSDSNTISNNTVRDVNGEAVRVRGSRNTISFNSIASSQIGIDFGVSFHNNSAVSNEIDSCGFAMTVLGSDDNRILQNSIEGGSNGIWVASGDRNLIVGNRISRASQYGVQLESSRGNSVHHNAFIDNTIQAEDDVSSNSWDDGYPSGGNYWSDYQGNDTFSGPNQDIPGSDGIGDTPYAVNHNGTDRYPLTEPTKGNLPPRNLIAHLTGSNLENVTLTWNLSWNDGQRVDDVTGYEIYRSSTYDKERIGYSLIGSTPNQTTQYMDSLSGEGDPNNYFYYVCAINGTGNSSCSSDQAGKFTCPLSKGPKLISVPLIESDETIQTVLQTLSYDNVWSYDPINQEWKSFSKSKPYAQSLEYLNQTMGIWVNVTQDSDLTVAGVVPTSITIDLQAGWNLMGFPSFDDNYTVADLKAAVAVERIEGYDGLAPPYFLRVIADRDFLQAGFGYWIRVETPTIWTVENI